MAKEPFTNLSTISGYAFPNRRWIEKSFPLIQISVALVIVGKYVDRQSAGETAINHLPEHRKHEHPASTVGKKSLNVLNLSNGSKTSSMFKL